MKQYLKFIFFFLLVSYSINFFGQLNVIDEINISANRENVSDFNTSDKNGFGIGVFHSFFKERCVNLVLGIEYNKTNQLKKSVYNGHFSDIKNANYSIDNLSIPFKLRFVKGNRIKLLFEGGGFINQIISMREKGISYDYYLNPTTPSTIEVSNKLQPFNSVRVGYCLGIGLQYCLTKFSIFIRPDYKREFGFGNIYEINGSEPINNNYFGIALGVKR